MTNERAKRFEGEVRHRYQLAAKGVVNKRVLDIGCGLGWGAEYLAKKKAKQVLGIDRSGAAINYARQKYSCPNLVFKTLEAQKIRRLTGSFDMVVAFELIEHLPKIAVKQWITDIKKILKPGGRVMISTPNKLATRFKNPYHVQEFTAKELKQLFSRKFTELKLRGIKKPDKELFQQSSVISWLGQFRIVQELLPLIPAKLRQSAPAVKASAYIITDKQISGCPSLLLSARKSPILTKDSPLLRIKGEISDNR